jgi:hypothetical protein
MIQRSRKFGGNAQQIEESSNGADIRLRIALGEFA